MPKLVELSKEYAEQPFTLIGVTDEPVSLVESKMGEFGMTYPVAAGFKPTRSYGIPSYPHAVVLNHEGKVIYKGSAWEIPKSLFEEAFAEAKADQPWQAKERHAVLKRAAKSAREGNIGVAWKAAESARKKAAEDADAMSAIDAFQQEILDRGAMRSTKANKIAETGCYFVAVEYLTEQSKYYKGAPPEKEWKLLTKEWLKDKTIKLQYDLDKKRLSALESAYKGDKAKAVKSLKKLMEKASGTALHDAIVKDYEGIRMM